MKKLFKALICISLFALLFCPTAFAAEPRWSNVLSITPDITSSGYSVAVECTQDTTQIKCTMILYEKGLFGSYTEVSRTSDTSSTSRHRFSGSANIAKGKTYKLAVTLNVTASGSTETVTDEFERKF